MDYTDLAVALFDKHADAYANKFMDVSLYKGSLDLFCQHLPAPDARILEIACGPGNISHYLLQQLPALQVTATDLAPRMVELAQVNNPTAICLLMDGRDVKKLPGDFHAIVCGFGLPYFSKEDALQFIKDCGDKLLPGGLLYISTMEGDYLGSGIQRSASGDEVYIYYHQEDYITAALQHNGLKVLDSRRTLNTMTNGVKVVDLVIVAQKVV